MSFWSGFLKVVGSVAIAAVGVVVSVASAGTLAPAAAWAVGLSLAAVGAGAQVGAAALDTAEAQDIADAEAAKQAAQIEEQEKVAVAQTYQNAVITTRDSARLQTRVNWEKKMAEANRKSVQRGDQTPHRLAADEPGLKLARDRHAAGVLHSSLKRRANYGNPTVQA